MLKIWIAVAVVVVTQTCNVRAEQLKVIQKFVFASYGEEDFETVEDVRFDSLLYTVENSFRKWVPTSGAIMEQAKRAA